MHTVFMHKSNYSLNYEHKYGHVKLLSAESADINI